MQAELATSRPDLAIQLLAVNENGRASGNAGMVAGRSLPLLQDLDTNNNGLSDVWTESWDVTYRDVVIVNAENQSLGAVNLTVYNLADAANYSALREILIDTAESRPFWQNVGNRFDVNDDGAVSGVGDVLTCINELNQPQVRNEISELPLPMPPYDTSPYFDVNGDGLLTSVGDVLALVNFLNGQGAGEGEGIVQVAYPDSGSGFVTLSPDRLGQFIPVAVRSSGNSSELSTESMTAESDFPEYHSAESSDLTPIDPKSDREVTSKAEFEDGASLDTLLDTLAFEVAPLLYG